MSDDTWDEARSLGSRIWQELKKATSTAADSADRHLKITKLRRKLKRLISQERDVNRGIGEKVYQLHQKGKVRNTDILEECRHIDELRENMEDIENQIRELQTEKEEKEAELEDEDFLTDEEDDSEESEVAVEVETPPADESDCGDGDEDESEDVDTVIDVEVTSPGHKEGEDLSSDVGDDEEVPQ